MRTQDLYDKFTELTSKIAPDIYKNKFIKVGIDALK
jgi:hypothetical protein